VKELILGGARSGKSALAEGRALRSGLNVTYIATATQGDDEMSNRIAKHQERRPAEWGLVEEPVALAEVLVQQAAAGRCLLVDCLTLWLTNLLCSEQAYLLEKEKAALLEVLPQLPGHIIFVSNEVGMGIVPMGELSRRFQDETGWLHQQIAASCDRVVLTVAGLPHVLKGTS
jgi:adenosylcobinamide kinase/adenosylcobinamide-phosphate guanylyltransferase